MIKTIRRFIAECIYPEMIMDEEKAYQEGLEENHARNKEFIVSLLSSCEGYNAEEWKDLMTASLKFNYIY